MPLSDFFFSSFVSMTLITSNKKNSIMFSCDKQNFMKISQKLVKIEQKFIELQSLMSTSLTYILYLMTIIYKDVHKFIFLELCQNLYCTSNLKCLQVFVSMVILHLGVQHYRICKYPNKCQKCPTFHLIETSLQIAKGFMWGLNKNSPNLRLQFICVVAYLIFCPPHSNFLLMTF